MIGEQFLQSPFQVNKVGKFNFIVIDDSALDCFIAEKMIKHTGKCEDVRSFTTAEEALKYIEGSYDENATLKTVIILDILMPVMDGFAFVEEFETLPQKMKDQYIIVALTSSMNKHDTDKIVSYDEVKTLLDKPITAEALIPVLS